jgi:hypothetical protein
MVRRWTGHRPNRECCRGGTLLLCSVELCYHCGFWSDDGNRIPGFPHRAEGYNDPRNPDDAVWIDAPLGDEDNAMRAVTVQDLLPATRYRARVRCPVVDESGSLLYWPDWELSPISDWYLTLPDLPEPTTGMTAASWEKRALVVQWKLPRINGSLITRFRLEKMRLRLQEDGDSDSASSGCGASDESESDQQVARGSSPASRATPSQATPSPSQEEDLAMAILKKSAAAIAARKAKQTDKRHAHYGVWELVVEEDVLHAAKVASSVTFKEDVAIAKLQSASREEFDDKFARIVSYGLRTKYGVGNHSHQATSAPTDTNLTLPGLFRTSNLDRITCFASLF